VRSERHTGFTLVEVMVVVVILGILAVLIVPRVIGRTEEARAAAAKHDIATIMQSLKLYHLDNGRYPTNEQGLQALVSRPQSQPAPPNWKPYLDKLPKDPWGNPYQYLNPGVHGEVDVFSLGADGQPGGTGADLDVGSWQL
jgi:general secretion pathway protein G